MIPKSVNPDAGFISQVVSFNAREDLPGCVKHDTVMWFQSIAGSIPGKPILVVFSVCEALPRVRSRSPPLSLHRSVSTQLPVDPTNFRSNHFCVWCQVSLWGLQWNFLVFDWISFATATQNAMEWSPEHPPLYDPMWENIWYIDIRLLAVPRSTKIMKEITPGGRLFVKPLGFNDLFDLFLKTQTIGIHQRGSATTHAAQSRSRSYWGWGEVSEFFGSNTWLLSIIL